MSNCTHCGKPAGVFRNYRADCRAQFERATATIPAFFEKLLQSLLPADRFKELLREVAATFHIPPDQLRSLSIDGIRAMVDSAVTQRLPTITDEDRILEIATTLGLSAEDISGLTEKLVKIGILRDLDEGAAPDRVTVVGPMPFELEADESIIWIFNGVKVLRGSKAKNASPAMNRHDMPDYLPPASVGQDSARFPESAEIGSGDLMITNRHVFIVSDDRHRQIPFSRLAHVATFSDGFQLARSADERPLTFLVDDPWFAANLVIRLMRLPGNVPAPKRETGPADAK